jgi:hypothetical protein
MKRRPRMPKIVTSMDPVCLKMIEALHLDPNLVSEFNIIIVAGKPVIIIYRSVTVEEISTLTSIIEKYNLVSEFNIIIVAGKPVIIICRSVTVEEISTLTSIIEKYNLVIKEIKKNKFLGIGVEQIKKDEENYKNYLSFINTQNGFLKPDSFKKMFGYDVKLLPNGDFEIGDFEIEGERNHD